MGEPIHAKMTWADYEQLPDDGMRYEVLDGELWMTPAPGYRHQFTVGRLLHLIEAWREAHDPDGRVLTAPFDVILADDTIVQPDLVYLSSATRRRLVGGRLHGPPDLVAEVFHAKSASRDRVGKLQVYARFQIPEYWLVDLDAASITMLALAGSVYEAFEGGTGDIPLASRRLNGLVIRPLAVFETD
jgi:Uma2 family endonuclease